MNHPLSFAMLPAYEPLGVAMPPQLLTAPPGLVKAYHQAHAEALWGLIGRSDMFGDTGISQNCYACLTVIRRRQRELVSMVD